MHFFRPSINVTVDSGRRNSDHHHTILSGFSAVVEGHYRETIGPFRVMLINVRAPDLFGGVSVTLNKVLLVGLSQFFACVGEEGGGINHLTKDHKLQTCIEVRITFEILRGGFSSRFCCGERGPSPICMVH